MDATFYDDRHLVKNKFPDVLFKKFCGPKDAAKLVADPHPPLVVEGAGEELSTGSEVSVIEPEPHQAHETESSSRAAEPSKAQIHHSSGKETSGERVIRPQKQLPRCTHSRNSTSIESSPIPKQETGPVADILKSLSAGCRRLYDSNAKKWVNWPKTCLQGAEENVAACLNEIVTAARLFLNDKKKMKEVDDDRVFSARYRNTPVKSGGAVRKPDIVLVPRIHAKAPQSGFWNDIYAIGELKSKTDYPLSDLVGDLVEYARLCFGHQPSRRFVLGFSLLDTKMRLWKFDRSGIIVSHEFDVHENPLDFLRVILGFIVGDDYYIGLDPSFIREDNKDWVMLNNKRYKIHRTIHLDPVIRGRGTVALLVEDDAGELLVMKDQWVDQSRDVKEYAMLTIVNGVKGVASLEDHQLVHFQIGDEIVHDSTEDDRSSKELQDQVKSLGVEIRDHYRLLMKPYGKKLEDFKSLKELVSVFRDYMQVIKDLLERNVVHRDISPRNVILVELKDELLRRGFLIDFDYAIMRSRLTPAKAERTGTLPFMAIDILQGKKVQHDFYHDVESAFYVLIWICLTQNGPNNEPRPASEYNFKDSALHFWCCGADGNERSMKQVAISKQAMMGNASHFEEHIISCLPEYFQPLAELLFDMRDIIFRQPEQSRKAASKNGNDSDQQNADKSKEALKRKQEDLDAIIELLQTTLNRLPDEEQPSVASNSQLKDSPNHPREDRIQAGSATRVECIKDQIPDLIRPCDWTNIDDSKHTPLHSTRETPELLRTAVANSASQRMLSRGEKRSHDEEAVAAPAPLSSSMKRSKRSSDDV